MLNLEEIKNILPHRFPFLMIDRVVEIEDGKRAKAIKCVTGNEAHFQGHFPGQPMMPGVLMVEAMAQTCGIVAFTMDVDHKSKMMVFVGINNARFKKPVTPGDQLVLEAAYVSHKFTIWNFEGKAFVEGQLVASADIRMAVVDRPVLD